MNSPDPVLPAPSLDDEVAAKLARAVDERALRTIFLEARSANGFLPKPVPREMLERITEIALVGPTSANTLPLRMVFVESPEAKAKLVSTLSPGNVEKTQSAPVTVIFAADPQFHDYIPQLLPPAMHGFQAMFAGAENADRALAHAISNATMQGAYFTLAARAMGLDVGPMGGFDRAKLDELFFPDGRFKSLWIANLGFGDDTKIFPRNPRFTFAEIAKIV
jgi:3-hydroxypropanoate dehydrogenase